MDNFAKVIGFLLLGVATILFIPIIGAFFGGITGWIVGLVFGETILTFLAQLGITGFTMFQIGVCLGFVGSFFRGVITRPSSKR